MPPHLVVTTKDLTMVEVIMMAQLMRKPLEVVARRWYCRSLFRASRGRLSCAGCTQS
jgi:hypothetical protein